MNTVPGQRVMVGVTGSLANLAALHTAVAYARLLHAELTAIRAWVPVGGETAYRNGPSPALVELWEQRARGTLTGAFTDAFGGPPSDITTRCVTGRGETGPVLVAAAHRASDLLVVGTGRRGAVATLRGRSVGRYCLRHALCPLLIVPQPEMAGSMGSHRRQRPAGRPLRTD